MSMQGMVFYPQFTAVFPAGFKLRADIAMGCKRAPWPHVRAMQIPVFSCA
jgi:hypothetical protein